MKTAIASIMIAGLTLAGAAGTAGVAAAQTKVPAHSGFADYWTCVRWTLYQASKDGKQYECQDFGPNGGWVPLWVVD
ncbi:hypothetical protein [Nocardia sp. NPDC056000]|uniref:hypothetical protein n=1 Tax=Nocardia sp. NPDC056000 TaxID=3345674 RepID=UPI0035E2C02A